MIDVTSDKIRKDIVKKNFYDEDEAFFRKLNITKKRYEDYFGKFIFLIQLSDGYYYTKEIVSEFKLCNEIVGRYLCSRVGLETTFLELLLDGDEIRIVTPNYRKQDLTYKYQKDEVDMLFRHRYEVDKLTILPKAYQKEQFKLIAIYMMMEQWDRHSHNMEEVIVNNSVHLTPVIDFENSFFNNPFYNYYNPYVNIPKDYINISRFLNDFPGAYKYFLEVFDVDAEELVNYIEATYPIKVPLEVKEKYFGITTKNQRILKMVK